MDKAIHITLTDTHISIPKNALTSPEIIRALFNQMSIHAEEWFRYSTMEQKIEAMLTMQVPASTSNQEEK